MNHCILLEKHKKCREPKKENDSNLNRCKANTRYTRKDQEDSFSGHVRLLHKHTGTRRTGSPKPELCCLNASSAMRETNSTNSPQTRPGCRPRCWRPGTSSTTMDSGEHQVDTQVLLNEKPRVAGIPPESDDRGSLASPISNSIAVVGSQVDTSNPDHVA
jgi:hypothetical protein